MEKEKERPDMKETNKQISVSQRGKPSSQLNESNN